MAEFIEWAEQPPLAMDALPMHEPEPVEAEAAFIELHEPDEA